MNKRSFTLVELLITMVVSALVINGVIMSLINSMVLNEYNKEFSIAMNIARSKAEEQINKRTNFSTITSINNTTTPPAPPLTLANDGLNGLYRVDVTDVATSFSQLKNIKVAVCWKTRGGRIIGDCRDSNNDGVLDQWTGALSSPCSISTAIAQR